MKKSMLLTITLALTMMACNQEKQYTENSPEIDSYKKVILDYENRDWKDFTTYYAENAKILNHVSEKDAQTISQLVAMNKEDAQGFKSWKYEKKKFLMLTKDNGEIWVYFNGLWKGTLIPNNKLYEIPAQINVQFENGKIVREEGYWDISEIMLDMQNMTDSIKAE